MHALSRFLPMLSVVALCLSWTTASASDSSSQINAQPASAHLSDFLDERGRLNLPDGFTGSLDPSGFELLTQPGQAPSFQTSGDGIDYDQRWSDEFKPGVGCDGGIAAIEVGPSGEIYFGGTFAHCAGVNANNVVRYQPATGVWEGLGTGGGNGVNHWVQALAAAPDGLYVAGNFDQANAGESIVANHIARWDYAGAGWSAVGSGGGNGVDELVFALAVTDIGDVIVGGEFNNANIGADIVTSRVARWSPVMAAWSPLTGPGGEGLNGFVRAIVADGSGVFIGGTFGTVNLGAPIAAANVVRWDPTNAWSVLGDGVNGIVNVMAVGSDHLYVGGYIRAPGTGEDVGLARWDYDQQTWSIPGNGVHDLGVPHVEMLGIIGDQLYVGGIFGFVDRQSPVAVLNAARWNTNTGQWSTWSGVAGDGVEGWPEVALAVEGRLYVGGAFSHVTQSGTSVLTGNVIRWDDVSGTPQGLAHSGGQGVAGRIFAMAAMDGDIYVGGTFRSVGALTCRSIARWDGAQWHGLGSDGGCGVDSSVSSLAVADGYLYVGGSFTEANFGPNPVVANGIARWDPQAGIWSALESGGGNGVIGQVRALAVMDNQLFVGGYFEQVNPGNPIDANHIASWDLTGQGWSALGSNGGNGLSNFVSDMLVVGLDLFVVGGFFDANVGADLRVHSIARWNGQEWSKLGTGAGSGLARSAYTLATANGYLYVGGSFTSVNRDEEVPARRVARWNLAEGGWSALGGGIGDDLPLGDDVVYALQVTDGELYAGGSFTIAGGDQGFIANHLASWNFADQSWRSVGTGLKQYDPFVRKFSIDGAGSLYAGGGFREIGNKSSQNLGRYATRGELLVRVEGGGAGRVVSAPAAIDCPGTCSARIGWNNLGLIAQAAPGSYLESWTGADCDTTGTCVFEFQQDRVVVANFEIIGGLFADGFE